MSHVLSSTRCDTGSVLSMLPFLIRTVQLPHFFIYTVANTTAWLCLYGRTFTRGIWNFLISSRIPPNPHFMETKIPFVISANGYYPKPGESMPRYPVIPPSTPRSSKWYFHFIYYSFIGSLKARGQPDTELVYSHYICSNKINIIVNISTKTYVVQCTCLFFITIKHLYTHGINYLLLDS
jgi:hypothetical protein